MGGGFLRQDRFNVAPRLHKANDNREIRDDPMASPVNTILCIVQYEERTDLAAELSGLMEITKRKCEDHPNCRYIKPIGIDKPHDWARVDAVLLAMSAAENCTTVVSIDSDATIVAPDLYQLDGIFQNKTMVISGDTTAYRSTRVWGVRNTQVGKQIMGMWRSHYDTATWERGQGGEWRCRHTGHGKCPHERGAFSVKVLPHYRNDIAEVSYKTLSNPDCSSRDALIAHFAGSERKHNIDWCFDVGRGYVLS